MQVVLQFELLLYSNILFYYEKKQQHDVMHQKKPTLFGLLSPSLFHLTPTSGHFEGGRVTQDNYIDIMRVGGTSNIEEKLWNCAAFYFKKDDNQNHSFIPLPQYRVGLLNQLKSGDGHLLQVQKL